MRCLPLLKASLAIIVLLGNISPAGAQDRRQNREDRSQTPRSDAERRPRRQDWRERRERMADASSEQRREMRVDWQVSMMTRTYDLTEEQQERVRTEVARMSDEYRQAMGADAEEIDKLRRQMGDYWRQRVRDRDDRGPEAWRSARDDPKFSELRERMQTLREKYPFDWEASLERVEKLIPPEQAATGRERRQQWRNRWTERRGDSAWRQGRDRGQRWRRRSRQGEAQATPDVDAWHEFTANFIEKYGFDSAQSASARAILEDVKERAVTVRRKQQAARTELEALEDTAERAKRSATLHQPINVLFAELKTRLENLVTERQRRRASEI